MKILLLSDEPDLGLWDHLDRRRLEGIEMVISCGDLPPEYLSFLTCFTNAPVLYVHGNHDGRYEDVPPEGCICIEDGLFEYHGVRVAGLGGCMRYKRGKHQYSDWQMTCRAHRLSRRIRLGGGIDVLVAHAPMRDFGDAKDLPHRGFIALRRLVERYHPRYFVHGHVHKNYDFRFRRVQSFGDTTVVNAWMSCVIELEPTPRRRKPKWLVQRIED